MEIIQIGKIVNVVGLKGEVRLHNYSEKERYEELKHVYVENDRHIIEKVRYAKDTVILKLSSIDDRNAAEGVKGKDICVMASDLPELPEDTYYIREMIGLQVFDDKGNNIGILSDVVKNSAQDLYEVETEDCRKVLIPAVEEFILNVDIERKRIDVKLIEGLM